MSPARGRPPRGEGPRAETQGVGAPRGRWLGAVVLAATVSAAPSPSPAPDPTPAPTAAVPRGSSADLQRLVEALAGTWSISETDDPRAGAPAPPSHPGTEVWSALTGGMTLMEENHTRFPAGDDYGTALLWWDGKAKSIRGLWCSSISDQGCDSMAARWEGKEAVMTGEWEQTGRRIAWKEIYSFDGRDSFTQTLFFGPPGGALEKTAVIKARREAPGLRAARRP